MPVFQDHNEAKGHIPVFLWVIRVKGVIRKGNNSTGWEKKEGAINTNVIQPFAILELY